jgi:hypothetical protein
MKSFNLQATLVVQLPGEMKKLCPWKKKEKPTPTKNTHSHYNIWFQY